MRHYFSTKFWIDLPVINGDQIPLHRNKSSEQETISFKNHEVFVKEIHHLSRERVTKFNQITNNENIQLVPEFVFKCTDKRSPKLTPPLETHYQWADKGSYRLEQLLETIKHLPNWFNIFSHDNFAIYVLDDYAVHLMPEIRQDLWNRGYSLVIIGGGITGFVQVNDTHLHNPSKSQYWKKESKLKLKKLQNDPQKVPAPDRNEMMRVFVNSNKDWCQVFFQISLGYKRTWWVRGLFGQWQDIWFCWWIDDELPKWNDFKAPPKIIEELINPFMQNVVKWPNIL